MAFTTDPSRRLVRVQNNGLSGSGFDFVAPPRQGHDTTDDKRTRMELELMGDQHDFTAGYGVRIKSKSPEGEYGKNQEDFYPTG